MNKRADRMFCILALPLLAFVLSSGMVGVVFASEVTRIKIAEEVQIDDEDILLGRIAEIKGGDTVRIQKIKDIVIGRAPLPGDSRDLNEHIINMRLKQNGIDPEGLVLLVPARIVVTRTFIEISEEKIMKLVSDYLDKNLPHDGKDTRIKDIRVAGGLQLPTGRITYKVLPPPSGEMWGKFPLSVNFDVNGKFYKRIWANATVEVFAEVLVTRKPLGRYKPITEDDIEMQEMNLADLPSNVITDPEAVFGKRTKRAIGAKTVLRTNLVEFPPLVKRGDVVVIIAESDGLKITALGQVKKKGALGDRIPVVNFDSKKVLYAQVLDSNTVKVEF
jgi:flagella basal body P-ring formation protein FlgA